MFKRMSRAIVQFSLIFEIEMVFVLDSKCPSVMELV